jgi:glucose/arabinose dehydrogenase
MIVGCAGEGGAGGTGARGTHSERGTGSTAANRSADAASGASAIDGTSAGGTAEETGDPAPAGDDGPVGVPGAVTDLATGLDVPWAIAQVVDGLLVTERDTARVLHVADSGEVQVVQVEGSERVPGAAPEGEGGLLGITALPGGDVAVYVSTEADNRVVRYRYTGDRTGRRLDEPRVLLDAIPRAEIHNGGRLAVGPDGHLYVTTGDARDRPAAQDPDSLAGKILRITVDGEPAPGNPIPGSPVWTYGHRNVQGIGWLPDGTMVASEFGQDTWDEVNVITAGRNYGWPEVEGPGGEDRGFVDPVVAWPPSEASPSGLAVTADAVYVAALRGQRLWRIPIDGMSFGEPEAYLVGEFGRLREVVSAGDGSGLLLLTDNTARGGGREGDDRLFRVALRDG